MTTQPDFSSIDPRNNRLDPWVFGTTAALIAGFLVWGVVEPNGLNSAAAQVLAWIKENLGWLFILASTCFVIFVIVIAISKYGRIPLSAHGEGPEFRTLSWISMMFAAGMGIGLMFFGAYEPLYHFLNGPPGAPEADVRTAMATTMFHWGFHPWAMYAVVGLAIAYSTFRVGRGQLISAVFEPLLGNKVRGPAGRLIDILAIFATLFGTVASLGLGTLQIAAGLENVGWITQSTKPILVIIIALLTAAFVASAVSGVARGIQWLSNTNMVLAVLLAFFVFVVGPTIFILNLLPTTVAGYFENLPNYASRSAATVDEAGATWLGDWTIFYWAWWISWTPFVGMFLAKISRGRTIREFVLGVLVVPTAMSLVWFTIFGGTAIWEQMSGLGVTLENEEETLFTVMDNLPWAVIASVLVLFLVAIFFITGADSASLVMATLSERGAPEPRRRTTIFWGVSTGAVAALLLAISGEDSLNGIQTMAIIAALPFMLVMIAMCVSLLKDLRRDPMTLARRRFSHEIEVHIEEQAEQIGVETGAWEAVETDDEVVDQPTGETGTAEK